MLDREPEQLSPDGEAEESDYPPIVSDAPFLSPSIRSLDTGDIENPGTPLFCIVQANDEPLIGSFSADTKKCTLQLTIDAGPWDLPSLEMELLCNGTDGPMTGITRWCLGDWLDRIKFYRVADCRPNVDIANPDVLAACETDDEKNRLVCARIRTMIRPGDHIYGEWGVYDNNITNFLSILFTNKEVYHLKIWFIAPHDLDDFEEQCLVFFLLYSQIRDYPDLFQRR